MRIVATSDTHLSNPQLPDGDVLIHAGDLCNYGSQSEYRRGLKWLASHKHPVKIYVPGNHDSFAYEHARAALVMANLCGVTMLVDETVYPNNIAIHGSPWS